MPDWIGFSGVKKATFILIFSCVDIMPQHLGIRQPFFGRGWPPLHLIKVISFVAREDMQVVVPNVLITPRFVVLPRGYSLALITLFQRQCYPSRYTMDLRP